MRSCGRISQVDFSAHLLEWEPARVENGKHDLRAFFRSMWPAIVICLVAGSLSLAIQPRVLPFALPILVAWSLSPLIAVYVSRVRSKDRKPLSARDVRTGRIVARRTWRFFEAFVGDEDHWLPPDNFQEDPEILAHRTSPTNIGLLLLSTVAAYDFGYVGLIELLERIEFTVGSLGKLQKFRGHVLNWHDTQTLQPLWPQYVSTVDSGNLTGCLIALKQACVELPDQEVCDGRFLVGTADTLNAIKQELSQLAALRQRTSAITIKQLSSEIESCAELLAGETPRTLSAWVTLLNEINERAAWSTTLWLPSQEHGGEQLRICAGGRVR
jgi:cyclic beta-1,2-glucan synthetase